MNPDQLIERLNQAAMEKYHRIKRRNELERKNKRVMADALAAAEQYLESLEERHSLLPRFYGLKRRHR